jgi:hypothetical protein
MSVVRAFAAALLFVVLVLGAQASASSDFGRPVDPTLRARTGLPKMLYPTSTTRAAREAASSGTDGSGHGVGTMAMTSASATPTGLPGTSGGPPPGCGSISPDVTATVG